METPTTFAGLVTGFLGLINLLIWGIFAFLFIYLIWKMIDSWILNAGDEGKVEEGKKYASTAVLVFVIFVITWGVVTLLRTSIFG
jgi:hypothetical protein